MGDGWEGGMCLMSYYVHELGRRWEDVRWRYLGKKMKVWTAAGSGGLG